MAADGKKSDRQAELEEAVENIRLGIWKPKQTLPKLGRALALILQELKHNVASRTHAGEIILALTSGL